MQKLIGYTIFWIAIGMTIGMFVNSTLLCVLIILLLLLAGYNLFMN
ncbi:MAG: hypothetical protein LIP12_01875 [Clostridiales bacterium]|nr:hypothetical protein [Clostridiales bacterium]